MIDKKMAVALPPAAPPIYNNTVGGLHRVTAREGFRNWAYRPTDGLTLDQVEGIIEAAQHARRIGLPFNRHITIRLERAGITDGQSVKAIGDFLTRIRDWLQKQGHRTAFAWSRENGPKIGSHVHILVHIPPGISLAGHRFRRWMEAISGRRYRAGTIRTKRISQAAYDENLGTLVGYLCKGALPDVADTLGLERRKAGGIVIGKRAGWSENVGARARRRWGWSTR